MFHHTFTKDIYWNTNFNETQKEDIFCRAIKAFIGLYYLKMINACKKYKCWDYIFVQCNLRPVITDAPCHLISSSKICNSLYSFWKNSPLKKSVDPLMH